MCSSAARDLPTAPVRAPRRIGGPGRTAANRNDRATLRKQGKDANPHEIQRLSISGGELRGRRLATPQIYMRPMMSRVREALFSMLYPTRVLRDSAQALDIFAGSGVVGIEALSRGVGSATFIDFSPVCAATIRANLERFGVAARGQVVEARAEEFLARPERYGVTRPFDLVTLTPPYEEVVYSELMAQLAASPVLGEDSIVVVEYPVELGVFPQVLADGRLIGLRNRRYGRTVLAVYVCQPSGKLDLDARSEEFVQMM